MDAYAGLQRKLAAYEHCVAAVCKRYQTLRVHMAVQVHAKVDACATELSAIMAQVREPGCLTDIATSEADSRRKLQELQQQLDDVKARALQVAKAHSLLLVRIPQDCLCKCLCASIAHLRCRMQRCCGRLWQLR